MFFLSSAVSQELSSAEYVGTGSFGAATINGKIYNQISFRPEIRINKLGIGLDFNIYLDENGKIFSDNWNFTDTELSFQSLMDKIYYVRWGNKNDDFYFRVGSLETITLGHGALIDRYSNSIEYPQIKKLGINSIYTINGIKLQYVQSNFKKSPALIGLQATYSVSPRSNLFISFAHDMNQLTRLDEIFTNINHDDFIEACDIVSEFESINFEGYNCEDIYDAHQNDSPYNNEKDEISGISIGANHTLSKEFTLYTEWASLLGKTEGKSLGHGLILPGLSYRFNNGNFNIELRHSLAKNFLFSYWDRSYDIQRTVKNDLTLDGYYTKETTLRDYNKMSGIFSYLNYNILNIMNFLIGYQTMGENEYNSFSSSLNLNPSLIPKFKKVELFYQTNNEKNPLELSDGTIHGYNIGVEASQSMTIVFKSITSYRYNLSGLLEPIRSMQLDTQFDF
tara:strand:- start:128 stop:1480 length:1353 start_codon:yes stop_codon:yes gene_type:complete